MIGRASRSMINDMPKDNSLLLILILAFGLGCVLGAVTTARSGNGAFLVPAALMLAAVPFTRKVDKAT